ncbi:MAG: hypothetical protein JXR70_01530 [Spirochaetales bacterium]|nr:hypothetical protein [Spirochaetales bacterium]
MIFFCIKKWFYTLWDNLYSAFLLNLVASVFLFIPVALYYFVQGINPYSHLFLVFLGMLPFGLFLAVAARFARDFENPGSISFKQSGAYLKEGFQGGITLVALNISIAFVLFFALPYYYAQNSIPGTIGFVVATLIAILTLLMNQYATALHVMYQPRMLKSIRKSLRVALDNPGFTLGMVVVSAVILAVSLLTLTFFPGIIGLLLWYHIAFNTRMLKYEYLEVNPDMRGKPIPWNELLKEERENLEKTSLRDLIFPAKK